MSEWALITGASSGIGWELAKLFAAAKFNVILVARNQARLDELASELRSAHGVEVTVIARDLSQPSAAQDIFDQLHPTPVSILVNNAGLGHYGDFAQTNLDLSLSVLHLNIEALVRLTHLFLRPMLARGAGKILNVASTAAFQPGPLVNVYYASKAFVYSFSYALGEELRDTPITVTTLCPGPTHTEFFTRGHFAPTRTWFTMDARTVAIAGFKGLMRHQRVVIPGLANRIAAALAKRLPARWTSAVVRRLHAPPPPAPTP